MSWRDTGRKVNFDLKHLNAFAVLADELHFGRAASRLGIAQPQLSQWIRRLEVELGVILFDRSTRTVTITAEGKAVLAPVLETLRHVRLIPRAASAGPLQPVGQVRIGYAGASSREVIPRLARTLAAEQPGIELDLRSMIYGGFVPDQIASGELDIGFSRIPVHHQHVNSRIFTYERVLVALPADHPLAAQERVAVRQLTTELFVTFPATRGSTVRDATMRLAVAAGFTPRIIQEAPDSYAILGLVAAGVGVTITVSSVQHISTPGLVYRDIEDGPIHMGAVVVWPRGTLTGATSAAINALERLFPTPDHAPSRVLGL